MDKFYWKANNYYWKAGLSSF